MTAAGFRGDASQSLFQQAVLLFQQGRPDQAEKHLGRVLQREPNHHDALHLLGIIAHETGRPQRAAMLIGKAIRRKPDAAAPYDSMAVALNALGRLEEALASSDQAVRLNPRFAEALINRGNILDALKRHAEAVASYDLALAIEPGFAEAHLNRAITLGHLGRHEAALAGCEKAIALNPGLVDGHFTRGTLLSDMKRDEAALACFAHVLALKPDHAEAHYNIGNMLRRLARYEMAVASYDRAIALRPDHADAWQNRGMALDDLGRFREALASREKVLALRPDFELIHGDIMQLYLALCQWDGLDGKIRQLTRKIESGALACEPFTTLLVLDSPASQRKSAEIFAARRYPAGRQIPAIVRGSRHDKIRIGYFSSDFREHAVSHLMVDLFENHDRSRFHLVGFDFGPKVKDAMNARVGRAFDRFIDVAGQSDQAVALLAREIEIDIAIDLGGFTKHARTGIFASRAAPVQVNYIGYLGTMGAEYMDYIIADDVLIPEDHRTHYSEKVAYVPSFQSNSTSRPVSEKSPARSDAGLPETGFVFCCFNNNFKITPEVFRIWTRIVAATPAAVLWLYVTNDSAIANLRLAAQKAGLDPGRLIFARRVDHADYLARLRLADLFLDTHPYNAGTTASDALWMGLPVLTRIGDSFAGRVGASLLTAIGLPELIAPTARDYESTAIALANDPHRLGDIRRKLAGNRHTTRLFDTGRFAASIEAAYTTMYERDQAGLPPDHVRIYE